VNRKQIAKDEDDAQGTTYAKLKGAVLHKPQSLSPLLEFPYSFAICHSYRLGLVVFPTGCFSGFLALFCSHFQSFKFVGNARILTRHTAHTWTRSKHFESNACKILPTVCGHLSRMGPRPWGAPISLNNNIMGALALVSPYDLSLGPG